MLAILHSLGMFIVDLFKPPCRLEAENLFLGHQLSIALRRAPPRLRLRNADRVLLIWMTRIWPSLLGAAQVVQPETILRWHRAGFKAFWRWKSRNRAGRPRIDRGLRDLIRRMSRENPKWGASRLHGELLMLGFEVAQSTVFYPRGRCANPDNVDDWLTINPDSFDVHEMHCEVLVARANKRGDYLAKFRCDDSLIQNYWFSLFNEWTEGRNIQIETRFAGADADRIRAHVAELVALAPEVI